MIAKWLKGGRAVVSLAGRALALAGAVMLTSCKQDAAEARFADDYHCQSTSTEGLSDGSFRVSGCRIEATARSSVATGTSRFRPDHQSDALSLIIARD